MEANEQYEEQLTKVRQNVQDFRIHYQRTAEAVKELMDIMAKHFAACSIITTDHLNNARNA